MRKSRRQNLIRVLERVSLALLLADVALFFGVLRPVENWVASEQQRYNQTRRRMREEKWRVDRLEKSQDDLPGANERLEAFKHDHVTPRRRGFSQAARLVRTVTQSSGIQLSAVKYRLEPDHGDPLERLGIEMDVAGTFPELLKFAHTLETGNDFILIREFTFEPEDNGTLALRLVADLYVAP